MGRVLDSAELGHRLRDIRGYRPQREIAQDLGVSTSTVGMYESGERVPRDTVKIRYAEISGKTVQEIFFDANAT